MKPYPFKQIPRYISDYLVPIRKREILSKLKEREDYNHRNTLKYFESRQGGMSVTQRLFKRAVSGWTLFEVAIIPAKIRVRGNFVFSMSF